MRYLNHAGTSFPKPPQVIEAAQRALQAPPTEQAALYQAAFDGVCAEFGADLGRLVLTSGCTAALALALGDLPWEPGDVLVTSSLEHHALDRQAQALELQRGVSRVALRYEPGRMVDLDHLRGVLQNQPVRAVALTGASNITGEVSPLAEISVLTRDNGCLLVVDAAQTFGTEQFLQAVRHADVVVAAGHKFALGPQGVGLLHARAEVEFICPGASCEVGETSCGTFPGFCDVGSLNLAGACGLAAGLKWSEPRRKEGWQQVQRLAETLRQELRALSGVQVLGPADGSEHFAPVVSFVSERIAQSRLADHFREQGVWLRVGTHCAPQALTTLGVGTCARVSFGLSNTESDVEAVLAAIAA